MVNSFQPETLQNLADLQYSTFILDFAICVGQSQGHGQSIENHLL